MSEFVPSLVLTATNLAQRIAALPDTGARRVIAIAGPPGSGKSTLAEAVVAELGKNGPAAALMPMDGFHLDDRLLAARGLLTRKGAPETFDFGGLFATLQRARHEASVFLPVFDRAREIAIAGASEIRPETRIVVVEGNYLCLDEDPWRALAPLWDMAVFLDVPMAVLKRRLIARWLAYGFDPAMAEAKAHGNDIVNAERVKKSVGQVDLILAQKDMPTELV
ncbi:MAG: nucleoside triphosphate hydrolase [Alphaproteobacteria bacterium]|nr:nucleoside triphosphate hydrolase [Alphaproteobacteria bacterium]